MKTALKLQPIIVLIIVFIGCQAPKTVIDIKKAESEVLYNQAFKALEERKFIIKGDEFSFPSNESPNKYSTDSYISMQNDQAIIKFSPDLFPRTPWDHLNIKDDDAQISKGKRKKNGEIQYTVRMKGHLYWMNRQILITLYEGTHKCFVRVDDGHAKYNIVNFTGYIFPLEE